MQKAEIIMFNKIVMHNKNVVLVTGRTIGIRLGTVQYLLEQGSHEIISLSRGDRNLSLAKEKYDGKSI